MVQNIMIGDSKFRAVLTAIVSAVFTYTFMALIFFGGMLRPIGFATFWSDRLALTNWPLIVAFGTFLGLGFTAFLTVWGLKRRFALALFIVCAMSFSTIGLGCFVEFQRSEEIEKFAPDVLMRKSFFHSLRNAPRDLQFTLHAAALKDCVPYAWSYREMSFYVLPPNVVTNVLPHNWVQECNLGSSNLSSG